MRRATKILLWSLAGLLLAAATALIFLATAGDDFYRWAVRQALEEQIDRKIHVDGSFSFDIGLEPAIIVTDVWIENAPWAAGKEMARARRIEVQIELKPLFAGLVRVPRLIVESLEVNLEVSPDGQDSWDAADEDRAEADTATTDDVILPLLESISLTDIVVTHQDRQSGRDTRVQLDFLHKRPISGETDFDVTGEGSLNQRSFKIAGRFGSIEEALAARTPYPMEIMLESSNLVLELTGTAQNLAAREGYDLRLIARTASVAEFLRTVEIDQPLVAIAEASARLHGDLDSLALEDFSLEILERSGQELQAEGELADLLNGQGLDLRFTGNLGPELLRLLGELPPGLDDFMAGLARADITGRMSGKLAAPVLEDLQLRLEHGSGAELSLQGEATMVFSEQGNGPAAFETTAELSLPDQALLEQALGRSLPDLGAIHATAELAWAGDWITLRSGAADAEALGQLQLSAEGRIGKLSGKDATLELDPRIELAVAVSHSRPLVYLLEVLAQDTGRESGSSADPLAPNDQSPGTGNGDNLVLMIQRGLKSAGTDPGPADGKLGPGTRAAIEEYQARHGLTVNGHATEDLLSHLQEVSGAEVGQTPPEPNLTVSETYDLAESLPELGPATAAVRLSREDGVYRLDDLRLALGAEDALRIEAKGTLGPLRPERQMPLEEIALAVSFSAPTSLAFAQMLPPELPEFLKLKGDLDIQGTTEALSISNLRMKAEGPDGLFATAAGQLASFSLARGFTTRDMALDLDVRWPKTEGFYRLIDLDLPELGPVWARATMKDRDETFTLAGIDITTGSPDQPTARVTGEIGDLLTLSGVKLIGEFDIASAALLGREPITPDLGLGKVHGRFDLSDKDGSIGLEALSAEIEDTTLFSLSMKGLFDDIERRDDLRLEVDLTVPKVSQLVREFGFAAELPGSLSFRGEVSGSDEFFTAEGKARIGETDLTGTLSGTLIGERPVLRAELYSPLFRFIDVGLVPEPVEPDPDVPEPTTENNAELPANGMVFGESPIPFETLRDFDLDLDVLLEDLEGVHLDVDKAEAELDLVDGVLRIDPLSFNFVGGRVDMTLMADAREELAELQLGLLADDVDLGDFLSQSEVEVPLDGKLDLLVDLKASGASPRALASSLEGEFDLAIQHGRVRSSLLRLTTTNPISWMFTDVKRKGYSDLNCLVLRFDLDQGLAESDTILLDTTNIRAVGKGRIDLRDEFIDIAIRPEAKKKRLIAMSTPFSIRGPLADPSVEVSSAGASMRTAGEFLVSPVNLLGSLLPFAGDNGKDEDNPCLALQESLSRQ